MSGRNGNGTSNGSAQATISVRLGAEELNQLEGLGPNTSAAIRNAISTASGPSAIDMLGELTEVMNKLERIEIFLKFLINRSISKDEEEAKIEKRLLRNQLREKGLER